MQRLRFASHCWRSKDEVASDLILWKPHNGNNPFAWTPSVQTYIYQLRNETDLLTIDEINTAMNDIEGWKMYLMDYRASST